MPPFKCREASIFYLIIRFNPVADKFNIHNKFRQGPWLIQFIQLRKLTFAFTLRL